MEKSLFLMKGKQKHKKNARKQKQPQKNKKFGNNKNIKISGNNGHVSGFKAIQARARNVAAVLREGHGRLSYLPAILERARKFVSSEEKDLMKNVMVRRFNSDTKALNLEDFGSDEELSSIKCQLFRQPFLNAAAEIITENIPCLEALNLNRNKLNIINRLEILESLPQLSIIYLANNNIAMLSSLNVLKKLPIVELSLEGNPFIKEYKDHGEYVNELKKMFPKLIKLDGKFLEPSINFDLGEEKKELPAWKKLYLCNPSGQDLVSKFVQQYFAIYDSDNRQHLLDAYHENAFFSITATTSQYYTPKEVLLPYHKLSRNLLHRKMLAEIRQNHLKRGRVSIVALLSELPPTKHDPLSFAVDLNFFTSQMIVLTITGIFKERNSDPKSEFVRVFQKTLIIVPNAAGGLCIKNELLQINNATPTQSKKAFKTLIIPSTTSLAVTCPAVQMQMEEPNVQMIQALSDQTKMNLEWSKKCLDETNFDYNRALFAFNELFKLNRIPQEAFSIEE